MPYTITKSKPIIHEYNGYKYELPNETREWIPDNWYETRATKSEKIFIDKYVQLLDQSLKYITDQSIRIQLTSKLVPLSEMPFLGCEQQIIHRYYKMLKERNRAER
jgi:hypothetical protein